MKVFVVTCKDFGAEDPEDIDINVYENRNDAIKYICDFYQDCGYEADFFDEVKTALNEENYFYDDAGNDPIEWALIEKEVK